MSGPVAPARERDSGGGDTDLRHALSDYAAGSFDKAEEPARAVLAQSATQSQEHAQARWLLAFSASRRALKERGAKRAEGFALARARFEALRREAAGKDWTISDVPSRGSDQSSAVSDQLGRPAGVDRTDSTLEEEAAYQHAVLTAALARSGPPNLSSPTIHPSDAEGEFVAFMRRYPTSPLVHAAVRRVARLHGGDVPKEAEAAWRDAMRVQKERREAAETAVSLCAPEVLAEVLRRSHGVDGETERWRDGERDLAGQRGQSRVPGPRSRVDGGRNAGAGLGTSGSGPSVSELAKEMGTDGRGTSLKALASAARRHGLSAKGLALSYEALRSRFAGGQGSGVGGRKGARYVIALVVPGHLVLVEDADAWTVRVWDPSGAGLDKPALREYRREAWERVWRGVVVELR